MNEIGSEFWRKSNKNEPLNVVLWNNWPGEKQYYLSGRTALYAILDDILATHRCSNAYLPSYCCHTMIEPFLRHGISVDFYSVTCLNGRIQLSINPEKNYDIILIMDYFGFSSKIMALSKFSFVIRDMTHSLLMEEPQMMDADYLFASLRKWDAIAGAAIACKLCGQWSVAKPKQQYKTYVNIRDEAYALKADYMAGGEINKQSYLDLFERAELLLNDDYIGYKADEKSIDYAANLGRYAQVRRSNAETLLSALKTAKIVEPIFTEIGEHDVPLFFPILVKKGYRDALHQYLITKNIYCPIHWPVSEVYTFSLQEKAIYEQEISLICDQRYNIEDMQRQIEVIGSFEIQNA